MKELKLDIQNLGKEGRMFALLDRARALRLGELPHNRVDLTPSQLELLRFVGQNPGCHLQDVAEGLKITSPTVSVSIRRLEEEGFIERKPDPADKRAACFYLTDVSASALQQMLKAGLRGMEQFLSHLTDDEQEQLFALLDKAVTGVETASAVEKES